MPRRPAEREILEQLLADLDAALAGPPEELQLRVLKARQLTLACGGLLANGRARRAKARLTVLEAEERATLEANLRAALAGRLPAQIEA